MKNKIILSCVSFGIALNCSLNAMENQKVIKEIIINKDEIEVEDITIQHLSSPPNGYIRKHSPNGNKEIQCKAIISSSMRIITIKDNINYTSDIATKRLEIATINDAQVLVGGFHKKNNKTQNFKLLFLDKRFQQKYDPNAFSTSINTLTESAKLAWNALSTNIKDTIPSIVIPNTKVTALNFNAIDQNYVLLGTEQGTIFVINIQSHNTNRIPTEHKEAIYDFKAIDKFNILSASKTKLIKSNILSGKSICIIDNMDNLIEIIDTTDALKTFYYLMDPKKTDFVSFNLDKCMKISGRLTTTEEKLGMKTLSINTLKDLCFHHE